ncbi:MAG TPA: hypothetical protein PK876_07520 [Elusimicrobiota bacterium]|nr:hypothetical protein [Elusimicrobiota bacterium]
MPFRIKPLSLAGRIFQRSVLILLGLLLSLLGLLPLEFHYRAHPMPEEAFQSRLRMMRLYNDSQKPPYLTVDRNGRPHLIRNDRTVLQRPNKFSFIPLRKKPGRRRIVVLGESSAEFLGNQLAQTLRRNRYDVMNCALSGCDLRMLERRFDEAVHYDPDLIILMFGHNFQYDLKSDSLFFRYYEPWAGVLGRSALFRQISLGFPVEIRLSPDPESAHRRRYQCFLYRVARTAKTLDVPVILCTLPANLLFPCFADIPETTDPSYLDALFTYYQGRTREAIPLLEHHLSHHDLLETHFRIGNWYLKEGLTEKAYGHLQSIVGNEPLRDRATKALNDMIRSISAEKGFVLFDVEKDIRAIASNGIPGWDLFFDNCHVDRNALRWEAARCLDIIDSNIWKIVPEDVRTPARPFVPKKNDVYADPAVYYSFPLTEETSYWTKYLFESSRRSGDTEQIIERFMEYKKRSGGASFSDANMAHYYLEFSKGAHMADQTQTALDYAKIAARLSPGWGNPHYYMGVYHLQSQNRPEARRSFKKTLELDPDNTTARYFLQKLEDL